VRGNLTSFHSAAFCKLQSFAVGQTTFEKASRKVSSVSLQNFGGPNVGMKSEAIFNLLS